MKNNSYAEELIRPKTKKDQMRGFFPAILKVYQSYGWFQFLTFPFMVGTMIHTFLSKLFGITPYLFIIPSAILLALYLTIILKKQLFLTYLNYFACDRSKISNVKFTKTTNELFKVYLDEKQRIEAKIRPKYEVFFAVKEQGFTLIGSTCIRDNEVSRPIHDMGIYWNGNGIPNDFFEDMSQLGYINLGVNIHNPNDLTSYKFVHKDSNSLAGFEITVCLSGSFPWMWESLVYCEYLTHNKEDRVRLENFKKVYKDINHLDYQEKKAEITLELRLKAMAWKAQVQKEESIRQQEEQRLKQEAEEKQKKELELNFDNITTSEIIAGGVSGGETSPLSANIEQVEKSPTEKKTD